MYLSLNSVNKTQEIQATALLLFFFFEKLTPLSLLESNLASILYNPWIKDIDLKTLTQKVGHFLELR